jgi:non-homologous end joining protein Ku
MKKERRSDMATATEVLTGKGEMHILNSSGDTKIMWDRRNRDEVRAARDHFNELRAKHYLAFRAEGSEMRRGTQVDEFDSEAEKLIMVPRSVGG